MKKRSMQSQFLITVISAMLAITIFIGGISIYEVDTFVQRETENLVSVMCEKEAEQVNGVFQDMEKAVKIMASFALDLIKDKEDLTNRERQQQIINYVDAMFAEVAGHANGAVAYYLRLAPEISDSKTGLFYSKTADSDDYIRYEPTDIAAYDKNDTERVGWYWQPYEAGKAIWMQPYYNQNNEILMVSYVVPMYYEEQFIGVVGMDFDYTVLTKRVQEIKIYEHGFAYLENDGTVVHYENQEVAADELYASDRYLRVSEELVNGMTLVLAASSSDIRQIRYDIALKILFVVMALAILFSIVVVLVVRRIVNPLKKLTVASEKLADGDYDVEIAHSNTYEVDRLSTAFEHMIMRLREHEQLQHLLAYRDSLTGLRNTTSYKAWVTEFNAEMQEKQITFGVVVLDVNFLKETNDRYGHDVGNKLLVAGSHIISGVFKRSPVFRIGGDEFLVILQNRDLEYCQTLLTKFEEKCAESFIETDGVKIPISIASGFAKYDPAKDTQFVDVFNRADDAMYENKRNLKAVRI